MSFEAIDRAMATISQCLISFSLYAEYRSSRLVSTGGIPHRRAASTVEVFTGADAVDDDRGHLMLPGNLTHPLADCCMPAALYRGEP